MVERVARALARRAGNEIVGGYDTNLRRGWQIAIAKDLDDYVNRYWPQEVPNARAAIEAMREVFGEMVQAGADEIAPYQADTEETYRAKCEIALDVFGAMIDAALADG